MANAQLPADIREALLDKLASDDQFRQRFEADPRDALASLGLSTDLDVHAAEAQACLSENQGQVPSKDAISAARKRVAASASTKPHTYAYFKN